MRHFILVSIVVAGCGGNGLPTGGGGGDLATSIDSSVDSAIGGGDAASPVDLAVAADDFPAMGVVGRDCPTGTECGPGYTCLNRMLDKTLPANGYCTKQCQNDGDCGMDAFCGPSLPNLGQLCFQPCNNGVCAAPNRVCSSRLDGVLDIVKTACLPGNPSAKDGDACTGFGDCNRNQACGTDPFDNPNGICATIGCTIGNDATCSPAPGNMGTCVQATPNTTECLAKCTVSNDCRTADNYTCQSPNGPNTPPMICIYAHAAPGSACASDVECGAANTPWKCLTGNEFPKGYCSGALGTCDPTKSDTCPGKASCYDPTPKQPQSGDEYCAANCTLDIDCRVVDGYHCLADVVANLKECRIN